ncbi:MAG: GNAT family N-acetyltransferase [Terracidiphilus sp.]|jgi:RimJ/RimL family protein N-acetyltransferase
MFEEDPPTTYLDTNRLTLRRWRKADRIPFAQLNRDRAVMEFMPDLLSAEESDRLETGSRCSVSAILTVCRASPYSSMDPV